MGELRVQAPKTRSLTLYIMTLFLATSFSSCANEASRENLATWENGTLDAKHDASRPLKIKIDPTAGKLLQAAWSDSIRPGFGWQKARQVPDGTRDSLSGAGAFVPAIPIVDMKTQETIGWRVRHRKLILTLQNSSAPETLRVTITPPRE